MSSDNAATVADPATEPLLGRAGDASQERGGPMWYNLFIGTAVIGQAGIWILFAVIWGAIFSNELMLFSAHPLLNSAALLLMVQAMLILQPTHTATQKSKGTYIHLILNDVAALSYIAALVIIEYNKFDHDGEHFESPHAILGLVTYLVIAIQSLVGVTMFLTPALYGGTSNAKSLYKYHRMSGYVVLLLALATVCASTQTDFNVNVLKIRLWGVIVASALVVVGVFARIKKAKFGL